MPSLEHHYPVDCPFCRISAAYPPEATSPIVPSDPDPERVSPECYLILSTEHVLAFLDILPIAPGHILLTTRDHYRKLGDLYETGKQGRGQRTWDQHRARQNSLATAKALGEYLPLISRALCRATGIEDWNIVQNNGERAAQVVPHVHFHLIPRYQEGRVETARKGNVDVGMLKSWRMFGRGTREELDEEEARALAGRLREAVKVEVEGCGFSEGKGGKSKL